MELITNLMTQYHLELIMLLSGFLLILSIAFLINDYKLNQRIAKLTGVARAYKKISVNQKQTRFQIWKRW